MRGRSPPSKRSAQHRSNPGRRYGIRGLGLLWPPSAKTQPGPTRGDARAFTQHYATGRNAAPTPITLLTGRYQQRSGLECAIGTGNIGRYDEAISLANARQLGLPRGKSVIPQRLTSQDYTCGVFGKWHLGCDRSSIQSNMAGTNSSGTSEETSTISPTERRARYMCSSATRLPVYRDGYMSHLITKDAS